MELPGLGSHCTVTSCNRLDFLPFECDLCHQIFCKEHQTYEQHNCGEAFIKDVKVPTCPLCNQPVPTARGEDPNIKVNQHIQQDCRSDKAKELYTNRCSFVGCKKKELVQVNCNTCRQVFCLKHRFETSHNCQGPQSRSRSRPRQTTTGVVKSKPTAHSSSRKPQSTTLTKIGADLNRERLQRQQQQRYQPNPVSLSQANKSIGEEEALRLAVAASLNDTSHSPASTQSQVGESHTHQPNTDEDEALARAIAASLNEQPKPKSKTPTQGRSSNQSRGISDCAVS